MLVYKEKNIMPYMPHTAARNGETLIFSDGTCRFLHNHYFAEAKLINDSTLLKLYYSFCRVEIAGERLKAIFNDIAAGRMGTISQNADDNDGDDESVNRPVIKSIVYIAESPEESFESECSSAPEW
jgi:hypothetical protein